MQDNPYAAPRIATSMRGVRSGRKEDLYKVAHAQKVILVCILLYLFAGLASAALPPEFVFLAGILILFNALFGMIYVVKLAMRVYSGPIGIVLGVLTLVPVVGLFTLLAVNGKATAIIKANGFRVGLLGADLSAIEAA